jgi:hypothetical protein
MLSQEYDDLKLAYKGSQKELNKNNTILNRERRAHDDVMEEKEANVQKVQVSLRDLETETKELRSHSVSTFTSRTRKPLLMRIT